MPAGALTTVPVPVPTFPISSLYPAVKAAVTDMAEFTVTVHVPVPPQPPPLQPLNVEPLAGVAVSVTVAPAVTDSVQSDPQLTPAGLLVTVPAPVPDLVTVRM